MDNPEDRIERLEQIFSGLSSDGMATIPREWCETDPFSGELIGPPPDATEAQLRTWRSVLPLLLTVPHCPPA
jgi:hypothetical protein